MKNDLPNLLCPAKLLGSVNNQIKYNESAIIRIEKTITPIDQMPSKVLNIMTGGRFEK